MTLAEVLPAARLLSAREKLKLIRILVEDLDTVAKEDGCDLESAGSIDLEQRLLNQLALTEAVVWSPHADRETVQALSDLLVATK